MAYPISPAEYLDSIPESERRYQSPVPQERIDKAINILKNLFKVMEEGPIMEAMGEIGLIDCVVFNDEGRLRLQLTGAQAIASAAALAAVYAATLDTSPVVVAEVRE